MSIISVEIMKTIDEREMKKTTKEKQKKTEKSKGNDEAALKTQPFLTVSFLLKLYLVLDSLLLLL